MSAVEQINEPIGKLKSRKRNLEVEVKDLEDEIRQKNAALKVAKSRADMLDRLIKSRVNDIAVSDHAVLRYLERKEGFDTKALIASILTDSFVSKVRKLGDGKYPIRDGMTAVVQQGIVVTIIGGSDGA